jgi:hypothetical protein
MATGSSVQPLRGLAADIFRGPIHPAGQAEPLLVIGPRPHHVRTPAGAQPAGRLVAAHTLAAEEEEAIRAVVEEAVAELTPAGAVAAVAITNPPG